MGASVVDVDEEPLPQSLCAAADTAWPWACPVTEWLWATAETQAPWLLGWPEPPERVVGGRGAVVDVGREDVLVVGKVVGGKLVAGNVDVEAVVVDETLLSPLESTGEALMEPLVAPFGSWKGVVAATTEATACCAAAGSTPAAAATVNPPSVKPTPAATRAATPPNDVRTGIRFLLGLTMGRVATAPIAASKPRPGVGAGPAAAIRASSANPANRPPGSNAGSMV